MFAPPEFAVTLGIDGLRADHRVLIWLAFVGSVSILATTAVWGLIKLCKQVSKQRRIIAVRENYLHELAADEKAYLAPYIFDGENTRYFKMGDGIVGGLVGKRILYSLSNIGNVLTGFAYNTQPWARQYLSIFPCLLDCKRKSERPAGLILELIQPVHCPNERVIFRQMLVKLVAHVRALNHGRDETKPGHQSVYLSRFDSQPLILR